MAGNDLTSIWAGAFGRTPAAPSAVPSADTWFGPSEPQQPMAPSSVAGRQFDFPANYNLGYQRRDVTTGGVSFEMLRGFADSYDLLRLVIETRKDQMASLNWRIGLKNQRGKGADDKDAKAITDFLAYPDQINDWDTWVRALVEEMLVTDAASIYLRRTRGGGLYALELIDGSTIRPVIDAQGRSPLPPDAAYQQILKGVKAVDYSRDELLYAPRNIRVWKVYGYSPVEQIMMTVQIALRRQLHQLQFYTEGTAPDSLFTVPEGWTPEQIAQMQQWFNGLMAGNTANRRAGVFLPYGVVPINLKEGALKDEFDEWLARVVCYAFNVSQQWAVKQMNRATSETADNQALREGLEPVKKWLKNVLDRVIAKQFGRPDLELKYEEDVDLSAREQSEINDRLLAKAVKTINDVRDEMGMQPLPGGDVPLIFTGSGVMRLEDVIKGPQADPSADPSGEAFGASSPPGKSKLSETPVFDRVEKAFKGPSKDHAGPRNGRFEPRPKDVRRMTEVWEGFLSAGARECADACKPIRKAETGDGSGDDTGDDLGEGSVNENADLAAHIDKVVMGLPWGEVEQQTASILADAAANAAQASASDLAAKAAVSVSFDMVDEPAAQWALQHSANLVSMVSDTTRRKIAELVAAEMRGEIKSTELADKIREIGAFSPERAKLIAHHESMRAANAGYWLGWKELRDKYDVPIRKKWVLGKERHHCAACEANAMMGPIDLDAEFPSGDLFPPAHPHCFCWMDSDTSTDDKA